MRWLSVGGGALALLTLFIAAGFAANVSCSGNASGNWYIYNKNVTCQDAFALNMTGTTVYIQGASNVTFLNITNTSINVYVYNTSNFTGNLSTLGMFGSTDSSIFDITDSTFNYPNADNQNYYWLGSLAKITNSVIYTNPSAINDRFYFNESKVIMKNATIGVGSLTQSFYFKDNATLLANDSIILTAYFQNTTQAEFTNTSLYNAIFSLTGTKALTAFNISDDKTKIGYFNTSDGMRINMTNSSITNSFSVTLQSNATFYAENSRFYGFTNYFYDNSTAEIVNSTLLYTTYGYFTGSSAKLTNTLINVTYDSCCGFVEPWLYFNGSIVMKNTNFGPSNHNPYRIYFKDNGTVLVNDSSILATTFAMYFQNTATVNATNTTWSGTKSFSNTATLYDKKYFTLFVNDSAGRALRNVSVIAYNATTGEVDFNGTTDAWGWLNNTPLLGYKQNATQGYDITMTINMTAGDAVNQTSYDMPVNRWYNATMVGRFNYFVGSPSVASFTPTITVHYGNESLRPWNGSRQVELRTGTTLVANLSWNFSTGDLNLSNVTVTYDASEHYVGLNGTNVTPLVTTFWVPVWGKVCNVRKCAGKANYSHCSASDWVVVSSTANGGYCLVAVNGTVVQDRPSAVTNKVVIRVPGWDEPLVAVLFALTVVLFAARGQRVRRDATK